LKLTELSYFSNSNGKQIRTATATAAATSWRENIRKPSIAIRCGTLFWDH
jgi:hypothetical protein